LIGEDGLDAFGQTYSAHSRIVVVVFRKGWGETRWTGVEDRAIRSLYLETGVRRILVYSVDGMTPTWLPPTYVWAGDRHGGLRTFAAVVERKVQEEGGEVGEEDVLALAQRVRDERAAAKRLADRRFSIDAVKAVHAEREVIAVHVEKLVEDIELHGPGFIRAERVRRDVRLRTDEIVVTVVWDGHTANSVIGDHLSFYLLETDRMSLVGFDSPARVVKRYEFHSAEDEVGWRWFDERDGQYSSLQVAEEAVRVLLREHERKKKAEELRWRRS
jgi:hypothetical protein